MDDKMSWSDHVQVKFTPTEVIRRLLHEGGTETYGLIVWRSCNKTHLNNLEILHARAGSIVQYMDCHGTLALKMS